MAEVANSLKNHIQNVAIVNGETFERQIPYWEAEIAGFRTIHVSPSLKKKDDIVRFIQTHTDAAICVQRLNRPDSDAFTFSGAELVAALYDTKIPALLVTQYTEIDQHSSLRMWADKVPIVLHHREMGSPTLLANFQLCVAELQGTYPENRIPYRVLLSIENVEGIQDEIYVDSRIDCWDHYQIVRFPLALIPKNLHDRVIPGAWFFAHVNVQARLAHNLYFREFELAPEPEYEENLTYCVNVLDGTGDSGFGEEDAIKRLHKYG